MLPRSHMDRNSQDDRVHGSHASRRARVKGKAVEKGARTGDWDGGVEMDGDGGRVSVACPLPPVTRLYIRDPLRPFNRPLAVFPVADVRQGDPLRQWRFRWRWKSPVDTYIDKIRRDFSLLSFSSHYNRYLIVINVRCVQDKRKVCSSLNTSISLRENNETRKF